MAIQELLLTAVQVAVEREAVTAMVPVEAVAGTLAEVDPRANGAAAWLTPKVTGVVCPAPVMVMEPVRAVVAVLAATEYATVPLPLPIALLVLVIQLAVLAAV